MGRIRITAASAMMVGVVSIGTTSTVVFLEGCPALQTAVNDLKPTEKCIINALVGGVVDPIAILGMCVGTVIDDVIAVVESLLAGPAPVSTDAGTISRERLTTVHESALRAKATMQRKP